MNLEINESNLRKAINIYHNIAYGKDIPPCSMEGYVVSIKDVSESRNHRFEIRLGLPCWRDARLIVDNSGIGNSCSYWFDTNDDGDEDNPDCNHEQNLEYKVKIENALREANIPVRKS